MSNAIIVSKVLVVEHDEDIKYRLKQFFDCSGLIGLSCQPDAIEKVLSGNKDLGAIFLGNQQGDMSVEDIARSIRNSRPELPLFVRVEDGEAFEGSETSITGTYCINDLPTLTELLEEHLFSTYYPMRLVQGMQEIGRNAIQYILKDVKVTSLTPYLIKDKIIFGEVFSLIPLESDWCRGFMMLQAKKQEIQQLVATRPLDSMSDSEKYLLVNDVLNEMTNLMWGDLKNRFLSLSFDGGDVVTKTQVPILINHVDKYISFGTSDPQLCLAYKVTSEKHNVSFKIYQKMIFHLMWRPEGFDDDHSESADAIANGDLELF